MTRIVIKSVERTILLVLCGVATVTTASAKESECGYRLYVKSNKHSIASTLLPNGTVRARGSAKYGDAAAIAAFQTFVVCVTDAVSSDAVPASCRGESGRDGRMTVYNIPNLKKIAFNTACHAARLLGREGNLSDIEIYATHTDGRDECQANVDGRDTRYIRVATRLATQCRNGLGAGEIETRRNQFTGWYFESATQIRTRIADHCRRLNPWRKRFGSRDIRDRIHLYEVQPDSGRIRARYDCDD